MQVTNYTRLLPCDHMANYCCALHIHNPLYRRSIRYHEVVLIVFEHWPPGWASDDRV